MKTAIRLTKIEPTEGALFPTPNPEDYKYGEDNGNVSIPKGYTLEGYCAAMPAVGSQFAVERFTRNGVEAYGMFLSSTITKVTQDGFETRNSKYVLEIIDKKF
jgi:hypothetical protein